MRLTTRTDLAMRVLMFCATRRGRLHRSIDIALACNVSVNHLMQVVPVLHRLGYVVATRGRSGGVELAARPEALRVGEVFRHFEAQLPFNECFSEGGNTCPLTPCCRMRPALAAAVEAFYAALDEVSLADLVADNSGLESLFAQNAADPVPKVCARAQATPGRSAGPRVR
ncbi:RrF2 family transcriptional regulator [Vannielia litorea]|uniref:Transcriptional regulator, BadM/Rrf2 family n=1 Tax=Vannielia litorea TaxID=1217970 RepID=A0A1N6E4Z9_9RHOB|nr:Rrf2 family transcriptional regulator [Vannielia litorea]SIN78110.1 transcriptional regulator, BadM/Rrf2 family [Vannielia litorea]